MIKIAISGKANSGKNTLSNILQDYLFGALSTMQVKKGPIISMAFADPIKEMLLNMFPLADKRFVYGASKLRSEIIPNAFKDGKPLSYRQALQDIGMLGRSYNENIWTDNFDNRFNKNKKSNPAPVGVIATDLRFINEMQYLKKNDFTLIRLNRDLSPTMNHVSETEQNSIPDSSFHFIVNNNKSIDDLEDCADNIIKTILKKVKIQ